MKPELTDLRSITRRSDTAQTIVTVTDSLELNKIEWLVFGAAHVRNEDKLCWLTAYMNDGVTDIEHDNVYALRLPLIGLKLNSVWYHCTNLSAWVDPNNKDDFCVPCNGYNPMEHEDAYTCEDCEEPHIIVPEGFYVPPFDEKLYEQVKGKRVEITIGLVNG